MADFPDQWAGTDANNARLACQEALIVQTTKVLWALLESEGVGKSVDKVLADLERQR